MIKKISSFLIILGTLLNVFIPVQAAGAGEIVIEAEDYFTAHDAFTEVSEGGFSEGKGISTWFMPDGSRIIAEYKVDVPSAGNYKITGVGSEIKVAWTSDWTVAVNDKDNKLSDFKQLASISDNVSDKALYKEYDIGTAKFQRGENTIYIEAKNTDKQSNGVIVSRVDYIKLTPAPTTFSFDSVEFMGNKIGVFEKGKNIGLRMFFTAPAPESKKYSFRIEDYWQRPVSQGEVTIQKGKEFHDINLGSFDVGWYRIYLTEAGSSESLVRYLAFSVTQPLSKRIKYDDTTLAMDLGLEYVPEGMEMQDDYIEALKLAGYDWVRQRGGRPQKSSTTLEFREKLHKNSINGMDLIDPWLSTQQYTEDLLTQVYEPIKSMTATGQNFDDVVELLNEQDLATGAAKGTADNYAAFFKAAAIALTDSDTKPYKSFCGLGGYYGPWIENMLMNDIMRYSDIYNYHSHESYTLRATKHRVYANAYSEVAPPVWNGEAGKHQPWGENDKLSYAQLKDGARVAITSAMNTIDVGTNKHFYFILRPYTENGGNFAAFHTDHMPFPIFSALANATYQLGEANLTGEAANLPAGVKGYMFDDGAGNDVFVFWADKNNNYVYLNAESAVYSDIMGYEEVKYADETGKLKIMVTQDPVYVKLAGRSDISDYYPINSTSNLVKKTFEPHERIIIQQIWPQDIKDRVNGYKFATDAEIPVEINVYNFNDTAVSGTIKPKLGKDISSDIGDVNFDIEAWGKQSFTYTFRPSEEAVGANKGYIRFDGDTSDGKELSPSVTMYQMSQEERPPVEDKDIVVFDDFYLKESWDLSNIADGGKSVTFQNIFANQVWSFPYYFIDNPSMFEGTSGFVFDQECGADVGEQIHQMYIYMKDGRNYYSGAHPENKYVNGKKRVVFPWSNFSLYYSPLGGVDIRDFRFEDISHISIGISGGGQVHPAYTISNFGVFYSELETDKMSQPKNLKFNGMEEGKVYKQGEQLTLNVDLPDDNIQMVRVMIYNDEYEKFNVEDKKTVIDLSGLNKGKYRVMAFAYNDMGYAYYGTFDFYVE